MSASLPDLNVIAWTRPHSAYGVLVYLQTEGERLMVLSQSMKHAQMADGLPFPSEIVSPTEASLPVQIGRELEARIRALSLEWPQFRPTTGGTDKGLSIEYQSLRLRAEWNGLTGEPTQLAALHEWVLDLVPRAQASWRETGSNA